MDTTPRLGLLVDGPPAPQFARLARSLSVWSRPVAAGPGDDVAAWLASSPAVAARHEGRPVAVWGRGAVVVTQGAGVVTIPFPEHSVFAAGAVFVPPLVRARWRTRLELPDPLIVTTSISEDLLPTAFALASAVTTRSPQRLLEAMAWGAPCVTDAACAAQAGVTHGVEVLVAGGDLMQAATALASDVATASRLSRQARRRFEAHHDDHGATLAVARALGLARSPVRRVLDDLRTPPGSPVRARIEALAS
jgi:hypothetical protein